MRNGFKKKIANRYERKIRLISDAPFCRLGQHRVYGVARHEEARIVCDLDANPSTELTFRWSFNSSAGIIELPASAWTHERSRSVARYLPSSDLDFGSLICSASNAVGQQSTPCVYHVIPAGQSPPPLCPPLILFADSPAVPVHHHHHHHSHALLHLHHLLLLLLLPLFHRYRFFFIFLRFSKSAYTNLIDQTMS